MHITGGGFFDNLPRVVPEGLGCKINTSNWDALEIFNWIQEVSVGIVIGSIHQFTLISASFWIQFCWGASTFLSSFFLVCGANSLQAGKIEQTEMFRTFNMGVGMVVIMDPNDVESALQCNDGLFVLGTIAEGEGVQLM